MRKMVRRDAGLPDASPCAHAQFGNITQNLIPTALLAATWFTALSSVTKPSTGVDHKGILVFSTDCTSVYLLKLFERPWMYVPVNAR
jgi:hypothetical protein